VPTDFCLNPYWFYRNVDMHFLPQDKSSCNHLGWKVSPDKLCVTGIPISPEFSKSKDRSYLKKRWQIEDNLFTILIMGGGEGLGPIKEVVFALEKVSLPLQALVVTGINRKLKKNLCKISQELNFPLKVLGYVREIDELMEISDLLITKPGGLTCAEALSKGIPIVILDSITGQEMRNKKLLLEKGLAFSLDSPDQVVSLVRGCINDGFNRELWRKRAKELSRPQASKEIVHKIMKMLKNKEIFHKRISLRINFKKVGGGDVTKIERKILGKKKNENSKKEGKEKMKLFRKRSRFYISILVIGMLYLLFTEIPLAQAMQPTQEQLQSEIEKLKVEITQLKERVAKLEAEIQALKRKPTVEVPPLKKGQIPLNKVFRKIPGWKVTLTSYERLEGGGIQFNFVIENLQEKPANFSFGNWKSGIGGRWISSGAYILDDKTSKYHEHRLSPKDQVTLIPNMPVEGHITFTQSGLSEAKVIVFYFGFTGQDIEAGGRWNDSGTLYVGPIKLR